MEPSWGKAHWEYRHCFNTLIHWNRITLISNMMNAVITKFVGSRTWLQNNNSQYVDHIRQIERDLNICLKILNKSNLYYNLYG